MSNRARTGSAAPDPENSVEFCVKPAEDLVLEGTFKSLLRVRANTPYSCIMLKSQRFASLFRHYAKHHGLDKDTLTFYFTEELTNEHTPESVHMQKNDEIVVRARRQNKNNPPICSDNVYFGQMKTLLFDNAHSDLQFVVGLSKDEVPAHKAVLTARSDYFRAMFSNAAMREAQEGVIIVENCSISTLRRMLEFIYTNRVESLPSTTPADIIDLMGLAEQYLLHDLKSLCEHVGAQLIDTENVSKLLSAAENFDCPDLKGRCIDYVLAHSDEVTGHPTFIKELSNIPSLVVPIVRAAAGSSQKKRKREVVA